MINNLKITKSLIPILISSIILTGCVHDKVDNPKDEDTYGKVDNNVSYESADINASPNDLVADKVEDIKDSIQDKLSKENREKYKDEIILDFAKIVSFINGTYEINGYSIDDVTDEVKYDVYNTFIILDNQIEKYFPDYKEKLGNIKDKTFENGYKAYLYVYPKIDKAIESADNKLEEVIGSDSYNKMKDKTKEVADSITDFGKENYPKAKQYVKGKIDDLNKWANEKIEE